MLGKAGKAEGLGGCGHFVVEGDEVEFGDDGDGAIEDEEMAGVSGTEAEGAVEGAKGGKGGLAQLQPVDRGGELPPFGPGDRGGTAAGDGGFGLHLQPTPSKEAFGLGDGFKGAGGVGFLEEEGDDGAGVEEEVHAGVMLPIPLAAGFLDGVNVSAAVSGDSGSGQVAGGGEG